MKAHEKSRQHITSTQALLLSQQGTIVQQLQRVGKEEKEKNRAAIGAAHTSLLVTTLPTPPISHSWLT